MVLGRLSTEDNFRLVKMTHSQLLTLCVPEYWMDVDHAYASGGEHGFRLQRVIHKTANEIRSCGHRAFVIAPETSQLHADT